MQNTRAALYLINLFFTLTLEQQQGSQARTETSGGFSYTSV